jgi:hypothetical protein
MADSLVFVIEEAAGSNPIRVELKDHDLPFGRPRKGGAFDFGGPVNVEDILLDGRSTPIIHTKQADQHPTIVKGHLRDRFGGVIGHARDQMEQLERIRRRMRVVRLSIARYSWTAFLREAKFPFEGESDFPYELTFRVLKGVSASQRRTLPKLTAPADMMARARTLLISSQAAFLVLALTRVSRAEAALAFDKAVAAVAEAEIAAHSYEQVSGRGEKESAALVARCQDAKTKCDALITTVQSVTPSTLIRADAGSSSACLSAQATTVNAANDVKADLRTIQQAARERVRKATRLYRVSMGDTAESIALDKLGSGGRAAELGLRPGDLDKPGKYIRIPVA